MLSNEFILSNGNKGEVQTVEDRSDGR